MTHTLVGELITPDGMARQQYWHQPELERVDAYNYRKPPAELRMRFYSVNPGELRTVQADWIPITVGHTTDCVGHAVWLERQVNGSVWVVGELTSKPPAELRYLSPGWDAYRDGTDVEVTGIALVKEPAQICMTEVTVLDGDLERHRDWRLPERHAQMCERARTRRHGPLVVHDVDARRVEQRDEQMAREYLLRTQRGTLLHGPASPVLRVR